MNDRESFLLSIAAEPDNLDLRLVYADWLEETGVEIDVDRARFIRLQLEIHKYSQMGLHNYQPLSVMDEIQKECNRLFSKHWPVWGTEAPFDNWPTRMGRDGTILFGEDRLSATFHNGFFEEIECSWTQFLIWEKRVTKWLPVKKAVISWGSPELIIENKHSSYDGHGRALNVSGWLTSARLDHRTILQEFPTAMSHDDMVKGLLKTEFPNIDFKFTHIHTSWSFNTVITPEEMRREMQLPASLYGMPVIIEPRSIIRPRSE